MVLLAPHIKAIFSGGLFLFLKWVVVAVYIFLTSNMLVTTLLGLYYMTDRIHRREATFVKPMTAPVEDDEESDEDDERY